MPPLPGEERAVTVFADVHAYFTTPVPKPLHHRFDKGSYFYIYHNPTRQTTRVEVANHPGSPEQDAFNGSLDGVRIVSSYKFPTLLTIIVNPSDTTPSTSSPSSSPPSHDPQEWRLPSADPREPGKYMYRLHTLDLYFWMEDDAKLVIDTLRGLLRPSQLDIIDSPQAEKREGESRQAESHHEEVRHEDNMSPVVQNLEHVAISDPAYANGRTRNSQNQPSQIPPPPGAGQPTPSPLPPSETSSVGRSGSVNSAANYAPMAYNPAAPPAPEPIAHREKTPPPVDAVEGTGLAAAALADHHRQTYGAPQAQAYTGVPQAQPYTGVPQAQPYTGIPQAQPYTGVPAPVPSSYGNHGSPPPPAYGSPPPTQASRHNPSLSSTGSVHRTSTASPYTPHSTNATSPRTGHDVAAAVVGQSFAPPPKDPNAHLYGSAAPPMQSPGAQIYGSSPYGQPHQPLQHIQPQYPDYLSSKTQPPPGGYSQYSYDQQPQQHDPKDAYDVHSQVYRPTEAEANKPTGKQPKKQDKAYDGSYQQGKLGERADKVEKGVNKYLKKFEKKFG